MNTSHLDALAHFQGERGSNQANNERGQTTTRRQIVTTCRYLRDIADDAIQAVLEIRTPDGSPVIYRHGSAVVRIGLGANGQTAAEPIDIDMLKGMLDRAADFVALRAGQDGEVTQRPARPPRDVCSDILATPDTRIPVLRALVHTPVYVGDCRLLATPGYDAASNTFVSLEKLTNCMLTMSVDEAKRLVLDDLLGGFPFVESAGRAHALAALLQPFVRLVIGGATPLYLIDAPARGTGKGLLAEVIAIVTTGMPAYAMTAPRDSDELEKRITAALLAAAPLILLDNTEKLDASALAAVLTADFWRGRLLGQSRLVDIPNQALWIATGNNVQLSDELVRRVVPIRLDAGVERPEERHGFKIGNLRAWALEHRSELVRACLSLIQHWVAAGHPPPSNNVSLGRYEEWCSVVGGVLAHAEIKGFLGGRERLHNAADRDTREWTLLCTAWWNEHGEHPVGATDILVIARRDRLLMDIWAGRNDLAGAQRIARELAAKRDRVLGPWILRLGGRDATRGSNTYRLERRGQITPETPATPVTGYLWNGDAGVSGVCSEGVKHV